MTRFILIILSLASLTACETNPYCIEGNCENGEGKYQHEDMTYNGPFVDGEMEGYGYCEWVNIEGTRRYEGNWEKGNMHGKGTYTYENGLSYVGNFERGQIQGFGVMTWPDDSSGLHDYYKGQWEKGYRHGEGYYRWGNGNQYVGELEQNVMNGFGIFYYAADTLNSDRYKGQWVNGIREGFGTYSWADGDQYQGEWKEDRKDGFGRFIFSDGEVFEGHWVNGSCPELDPLLHEKYPDLF